MQQLSRTDKKLVVQIGLILSQVTFGVFWAALFIPPLDLGKIFILIFNGIITITILTFVWVNRR